MNQHPLRQRHRYRDSGSHAVNKAVTSIVPVTVLVSENKNSAVDQCWLADKACRFSNCWHEHGRKPDQTSNTKPAQNFSHIAIVMMNVFCLTLAVTVSRFTVPRPPRQEQEPPSLRLQSEPLTVDGDECKTTVRSQTAITT